METEVEAHAAASEVEESPAEEAEAAFEEAIAEKAVAEEVVAEEAAAVEAAPAQEEDGPLCTGGLDKEGAGRGVQDPGSV